MSEGSSVFIPVRPWKTSDPVSVVGMIVKGRLAFSETMDALIRTMQRLKFEVMTNGSPYWGQSLTHVIKQALHYVVPDGPLAGQKCKYLLFFDGDSVWENEDLLQVYRVIENGRLLDKTIDAVFPVQADRHGDKPITYGWNSPGLKYDYGAPFCHWIHGHFGLTLIRREVFEKMPEPWFLGQPATDGTWDQKPGKMDDDTYFWLKFNSMGGIAVQVNCVTIGHMQVGIRWQMGAKVVWQRVQDYWAYGKPMGCRAPLPSEYPGEANPCSMSGTGACIDNAEAWSATPIPNPLPSVAPGTTPAEAALPFTFKEMEPPTTGSAA